MQAKKWIALVAHDAKKIKLIHWVKTNVSSLKDHVFECTGTTGKRIKEARPQLHVAPLKSGPLGGDQQIGARIAEGQLDILIFFNALSPHPHDADVRALTRAFDALQCRDSDQPDDGRLHHCWGAATSGG